MYKKKETFKNVLIEEAKQVIVIDFTYVLGATIFYIL